MVRAIAGYVVLAVVGIFALQLVFGLLGMAFKVLWAVLWLAALGFVFYLVLRIVSPRTADRVKETIRGQPE